LILGFRDSFLFLGFTEPVSQPSSNSSSPHGGGLKVASELKTGSVMDILGKSDTSRIAYYILSTLHVHVCLVGPLWLITVYLFIPTLILPLELFCVLSISRLHITPSIKCPRGFNFREKIS
jgi:hypothetical protein